jgi:competence protein ComEC
VHLGRIGFGTLLLALACGACTGSRAEVEAVAQRRVSVADIATGALRPGARVSLRGVVATSGLALQERGFFVRDAGGDGRAGIFVSTRRARAASVSPGDVLDIDATCRDMHGSLAVEARGEAGIRRSGRVPAPSPVSVSIRDLAATPRSYAGALVEVRDCTCADANPDAPRDFGEFLLEGGIRVDDMFFDRDEAMHPTAGQRFRFVTGLVRQGWGTFKIEPRAASDIDTPRPTLLADVPRGSSLVEFVDVGQGDGALVLLPTGEAIVIDGGNEGHGYWDMNPVLDAHGVSVIDLVIASHPHADHVGGLDEVIRTHEVCEIWDNGRPADTRAFRRYAEARDRSGAVVLAPAAGHATDVGDARVIVLATDDGRGKEPENDDSLVVMLEIDGRRILFPGDVQRRVQALLASKLGDVLDCDVLKAPHHGSNRFSLDFLLRTAPAFAAISVGAVNEYGLPGAAHESALGLAGADYCRTDVSGDIAVIVSHGVLRARCGPFVRETD